MATAVIPTNKTALDTGYGGVFNIGYRNDTYAMEAGILYDQMSGDGKPTYFGGSINGLLFPFESLPNFYGRLGLGGIKVKGYPVAQSSAFSTTTADAGIGYLFQIGRAVQQECRDRSRMPSSA
eukprot:TRINITY_DN8846_c0_g1_i1.p1 TRINITY_DN8846_c0_g1~~TRINITY_DN8846_c0_g1_i1.p1  ORF type:complete len:123 (+),score=27.95 TRINITY_DN8846_c0_g1_i1:81-449(+)